jgi:hypothetical protein
MWWLLAGIGGFAGLIILAARMRRGAAARKHLEVGAVSEGWLAEHRGGRHY